MCSSPLFRVCSWKRELLMSDLREKLEQESTLVTWETLAPHAERDVVICVTSGVNLIDAAYAVATDDVARVNGWIGDGSLVKPPADLLKEWEQEPGKFFHFVIVQPFVLVAEYRAESEAVH